MAIHPVDVNYVNDITVKHPKVSVLLIRLSQEIAPNIIKYRISSLSARMAKVEWAV